MNKSIYIYQNLPDELVAKYHLSQAANNFCNHIVALDYFSSYLSVPPINVDETFSSCYDEKTQVLYHTIRLFPHKGFGKIINGLLDNLWIYWKVLCCKERNVWWYNVYTGNVMAYMLVRFFSSKKNFILLADYNPNRYNFYIKKILLNNIRHAKGVLSLSARCSELNKNFKSIAGIVPISEIKKGQQHSLNNKFLLSGTLNKNTGLYLAVDVFKQIPEAELILTGWMAKSDENWIKEIMLKHSNIKYIGFLDDYSLYIKVMQSVDIVLSLRDPNVAVNRYNFPSKILETLAYNKLVISTIKYPELEGIDYIVSEYDSCRLFEVVQNIVFGTINAEKIRKKDNANILMQNYSEVAWIKAIKEIELNS